MLGWSPPWQVWQRLFLIPDWCHPLAGHWPSSCCRQWAPPPAGPEWGSEWCPAPTGRPTRGCPASPARSLLHPAISISWAVRAGDYFSTFRGFGGILHFWIDKNGLEFRGNFFLFCFKGFVEKYLSCQLTKVFVYSQIYNNILPLKNSWNPADGHRAWRYF